MTRLKMLPALLLLAVCAGCRFEEEGPAFGIAPEDPEFDPQATFRFGTFGDEAL